MIGKTRGFQAVGLTLLTAVSLAQTRFGLPDEPFGGALPGARDVHVIEDCTVTLISTLELPAGEAGVLTEVNIEQGSEIRAEQVIARIDPREAELTVDRATHDLAVARMQAEDRVQIEYAEQSVLVEREDWEEVVAANEQFEGAVSGAEVRRQRHEYNRAISGLEKAINDQKLAGKTALVKRAELELAKLALDRRVILSPIDGEVLKLVRERGEWVRPGDVIAELVDLETLQVDGFVLYDDFIPSELEDCRVTIEVQVGRNRDGSPRTVEASGWVSYINPIAGLVSGKNRYSVRAKITNRREPSRDPGSSGRWLISPQMKARMKIHLGTAAERRIGERPGEARVAK